MKKSTLRFILGFIVGLVIALIFGVLLVLTSTTTHAQTDTTSVKLSNIEVTGIRTSKTVPLSQVTLSKLDIDKKTYNQEMVYFIDKTPSITSQSDGGHPNGYVSFRLRGIDQTRINMTLNGVPLNEPEDQGVYFSNYPNFLSSLKSLQIQRGIGLSSNGTASYGGSINFESQNGLDKGGSIGITGGSFNTYTYNANYSTGLIKEKLSFFGSSTYYKSNGYRDNSWGNGYSLFLSGGYYGKNDVIKFIGFTGQSKNGMAWYAVSEEDIKKNPKTSYNSPLEKDNFHQSFVQGQWIHELNKYSILSNTLYYNRLDGNYGTLMSEDNLYNIDLGSNFYGLTTNYRYNNENLTLNIGDNINVYNRKHIGSNSFTNEQLYTNIGDKREISGYTKVEYKLNNFNFYGDLQLRNTTFSYNGDVFMKKQEWLFLNPRGGVTYNINNKQNVYLTVGQSHREPTRTDLFGGNDNLVSLSDIKPESVIDYEFGYNLKNDKLILQTNLYYMDFKHEITLAGGFTSNSLLKTISVDKSFRSGVEFDATYKLNKHVSLTNSSSYSYSKIKGEDEERTPLLTPSWIINQGIDYTLGHFMINLSGRYLSKSYINLSNTEYIPSYVLVNSKIGYKTSKYEVSVQLNNLMNKLYYTGGYESKSYFVGSPRSFYVTIKRTL